MRKAVNNLTDSPLTLGGVKIEAKSQRVVRESLISKDEKKSIKDTGATMTVAQNEITVEVKDGKGSDSENVKHAFKDVAYPSELIKNDGTLNGKPALKSKIEQLQAVYGETILNDIDFKEKYPDADIENHRVEVGA
jgi:hypothetical protein